MFLCFLAQAPGAQGFVSGKLTVEVSWLDLFRLGLWWITIAMSFHLGRTRFESQPKQTNSHQASEVNEKLPQVFMAKKGGKVLHIQSSCRHLVERELLAIDWCSTCVSGSAKSSKIA